MNAVPACTLAIKVGLIKIFAFCRSFHVFVSVLISWVAFSLLPSYCLADWSGSISFTTDYIDHGYSKSDGDFAFLANLDYQFESGLFTGFDIASVDFADHRFNNRSNVEISPYLGWYQQLAEDWDMTARWQRYLYDDNIQGQDADYNLFNATVNFRDLLSARIGFSDNFYGQDAVSGHYELTKRYQLTDSLQISATVGYNQSRQTLLFDYLVWNAGLSWFHPYGLVDIRYVDSKAINDKNPDADSWRFYPDSVDAKVVLTIAFGF